MEDIKKIEIRIISLTRNIELIIIPETLKIYVEDKINDISLHEIEQLLKIMCLWNNEYIDDKIIDSEKFIIKIYTDHGVDEYYGNGKYPANYQAFIEEVEKLYGNII